MDNKKLWQTVVSAVAIVWIFCFSFIVSMKVADKQRNAATTTSLLTQATTASTTTTKPTTTGTTMERNTAVGNNVSVEVSVGDPDWLIAEQSSKAEASSKKAEEESKKAEQSKTTNTTTTKPASNTASVPSGKADIINAYITGVNALKKQQNFSLTVTDNLDITIDDITGGTAVQNLADSLMAQNVSEPENYTFIGGVDSATGSTPTQVIAPLNRDASVNNDAVLSAEATSTGDGGYTVKIVLIDELQTYTTPAPNHLTMVEVVDVEPLLPTGVTIKSLDLTYTGTTIEATFNKDNKIINMLHYMCVKECTGSGSMAAVIPITVKIHGEFTSQYDITY